MRRSIGAGIGCLRTGQRNYGSGRGRLWLAVLTVAFAGALVRAFPSRPPRRSRRPSIDAHPDHAGPQLRCLPRWGRVPGVLRRHSVRHVARVRRCALRAGQHSCRRWGIPHNALHAGQPDGPTGTGAVGDPYRVVTVVDLGTSGLRLTETDSYIVGQESYRTDVQVSNTGGASRDVILYRAGDCFLQNSDFGFGAVNAGTGAVTCLEATNSTTPGTRIEQFFPITPGRTTRPSTTRCGL